MSLLVNARSPQKNYTPTQVHYRIVSGSAVGLDYCKSMMESGRVSPNLACNFKAHYWNALNAINDLKTRAENWNGGEIPSPNPASIRNADRWIRLMCRDAVSVSGQWRDPHIASDENGDVALQWWNGDRGLTVYVSPTHVEWVRDWGTDIENQMEDGAVNNESERRALWQWLMKSG